MFSFGCKTNPRRISVYYCSCTREVAKHLRSCCRTRRYIAFATLTLLSCLASLLRKSLFVSQGGWGERKREHAGQVLLRYPSYYFVEKSKCHKISPLNAFPLKFGYKIIFVCFVNFWHQQDSISLFKGSIGHVTSQCKSPIN